MPDKSAASDAVVVQPLTLKNFDEELEGLREDLVNWDHGHSCSCEEGRLTDTV